MADSIRQQIMTAIDTRLKLITITNGYETNAGNNVYEFWDIALEDDELPAIIWRDGAEDSDLLVNTTQDIDSRVNIADIGGNCSGNIAQAHSGCRESDTC